MTKQPRHCIVCVLNRPPLLVEVCMIAFFQGDDADSSSAAQYPHAKEKGTHSDLTVIKQIIF